MKRIITTIIFAFSAAMSAFGQVDIQQEAASYMEKVYTVKFGYSTVYYSPGDGYQLNMHTDSRNDGNGTFTVIILGKNAKSALRSVDQLMDIINNRKLFSEIRQKGERITLAYEVGPVGDKRIVIHQESNVGDSRLDMRQLKKLNTFFTQKAVEEEAKAMKEKELTESYSKSGEGE